MYRKNANNLAAEQQLNFVNNTITVHHSLLHYQSDTLHDRLCQSQISSFSVLLA